jgi:hypothetical protein
VSKKEKKRTMMMKEVGVLFVVVCVKYVNGQRRGPIVQVIFPLVKIKKNEVQGPNGSALHFVLFSLLLLLQTPTTRSLKRGGGQKERVSTRPQSAQR